MRADSGPARQPCKQPATQTGALPLKATSQNQNRKPRSGPEFAIGLIAAKPLKPCDGGVFRGLDLLPKKERRARISKQRRRDRLAATAWLRLSGCTGWHWRCGAIAEKLIAARRAERRFFRYRVDSAKSRQTVRWGRFWGLGFAPENGAQDAKSKALPPLPFVRCRSRSLASVWRCDCSKPASRAAGLNSLSG